MLEKREVVLIMTNQIPLRYSITSWRQLPHCLSNNSRDLRIHITDFVNNDLLRGFRISVDHVTMGTLFACVLEARGVLVTNPDEYSADELSVQNILDELAKYGFLVEYKQKLGLSGEQLEYLNSIKELGYDKIRILNVWEVVRGGKAWNPKVVAFMSSPLGDWLNNGYSASKYEFTNALVEGTAINLTDTSKAKQYRWDWLKDFVAGIDDIINENADDMIETPVIQEQQDTGELPLGGD